VRLQFIGALWRFWFTGHHLLEGLDWLAKALPARSDTSVAVRALALSGASILLWRSGDVRLRAQLAEEALACAREVDDRQSIAYALISLGCLPQEDHLNASLLEESLLLLQQVNNRWGQAFVSLRLGETLTRQEKFDQAIARIEQGHAFFRSISDELGVTDALSRLGDIALARGDYKRATILYEESLTIKLRVGDLQAIASSHWDLGTAAYACGDYVRAYEWYTQALVFFHRVGYPGHTARLIELLADVAAAQHQFMHAARLFGAAEALREGTGYAVESLNRSAYACSVAMIRARLGEASFSAAWAAGRAMTLEQAIAEALGNRDPSYRARA
jgi:tetratricopeptide (TPR) repeat protein